ncbi:MAG: hypothetical protein AB7P02_01520 [Alphaproteobacteria bacterium]
MTAALRRDLVARARAGDLAAIDLVITALPDPLPAAVARRRRDAVIVEAALRIMGWHPGISLRSTAATIARIGEKVARGWKATTTDAPTLTEAERREVADLLRPIIDGAFLDWRQVVRVIRPGSDDTGKRVRTSACTERTS